MPQHFVGKGNKIPTTIVYGTIVEENSLSPLPSATIIATRSQIGTTSDENGNFRLIIRTNHENEIIEVRFLGFKTEQIPLDSIKLGQPLEIRMKSESFEFGNVVVLGQEEPIQKRVQMSHINVPLTMVEALPSFMGQTDIFKNIQTLPGVSSDIEGSSGFFVRGGGSDQILFLLDGAPVFFPYHSGGFVSVFPSSIIQNLDFYSGAFPALYGGRLSAVTDITSKSSRSKQFSGNIQIGVISTELNTSGTISNNLSFSLSGRKSVLPEIINSLEIGDNGIDLPQNPFSDVFLNITSTIGDHWFFKTSLFLSSDELSNNNNLSDTDSTTISRFKVINNQKLTNSAFSSSLFYQKQRTLFQVTLYSSTFRSSSVQSNEFEEFSNSVSQGIISNSLKTENRVGESGFRIRLDYKLSNTITLKASKDVSFHTYTPSIVQEIKNNSGIDQGLINQTVGQGSFTELSQSVSSSLSLNRWIDVDLGLRNSIFVYSTMVQNVLQPRVGLRVGVGKQAALKLSYAKMVQPVHFVSTRGFGINSDMWLPSSNEHPVETANIYSLGLAMGLIKDYELSLEVYSKQMNGILDYKLGTVFLNAVSNLSEFTTDGTGWSRGLEAMFSRKVGRISGWISYTHSKSTRSFTEIANGEEYRFTFDRPHIANINVRLQLSKRVDISSSFVYQSGHLITLPQSFIDIPPNNAIAIGNYRAGFDVSKRNNFRIPDYHRMDFSATYSMPSHLEPKLSIGVYNIYNRMNPVGANIGFLPSGSNNGSRIVATYDFLFPILPYISFSISFP